jgi:hypothetical protein
VGRKRELVHFLIGLAALLGVGARHAPDGVTSALTEAGLSWETLRFNREAMGPQAKSTKW